MAGHIQGIHRSQRIMFPESLDEYIDAFVDGLDLRALGFERAVARETGRPPYHPGVLHVGPSSS